MEAIDVARANRALVPPGHGDPPRDAGDANYVDDTEVIAASSDEQGALKDVERLLADTSQDSASGRTAGTEFIIVGPDGRKAPIPASLHRAVLRFVRLAQRRPVQISSRSRYLSTTQAAEVLGVSRPFLIKLLENGELPGEKVGTKRRVAVEDLMAYKRARDASNANRRAALERLIETSGETDVDLGEVEDFYRRRRIRGTSRQQGGKQEHSAPGDALGRTD